MPYIIYIYCVNKPFLQAPCIWAPGSCNARTRERKIQPTHPSLDHSQSHQMCQQQQPVEQHTWWIPENVKNTIKKHLCGSSYLDRVIIGLWNRLRFHISLQSFSKVILQEPLQGLAISPIEPNTEWASKAFSQIYWLCLTGCKQKSTVCID